MYTLSGLFIYPIKSLQGISLQEVVLCRTGFDMDRTWMLVDEEYRFLSQRECNRLTTFTVQLDGEIITVTDRENPSSPYSFHRYEHSAEICRVSIWEDICDAIKVSKAADAWFSERLGRKVHLVYMPESSVRKVDPDYAIHPDDPTSFSDGFPILMVGQASLNELNRRLDMPVTMDRFRPNLVFSGGHPHDEDKMGRFSINEWVFHGVKRCARCVVTTINPSTGIRGKEPLRTLSFYRNLHNSIYFGQNVIGHVNGRIAIGDTLQVEHYISSDDFVLQGH